MKIYCKECSKYVGDIRDASLIKGLIYICPTCNEENNNSFLKDDIFSKTSNSENNDFSKIFGDIFKNKYKK